MHSVDELALCLGNIDGHVGWHVDGLDGVGLGFGAGQRNVEGECCWHSVWWKNYVFQPQDLR